MKKITLFSVYLLLALAIFAPKVCASEEDLNYLKNTMNSITKEKILLEGPLYDENQPLYELDNRIMRGEFFDATVDINESSCDSTKCKVVLTKGDVSYTQTDVKYYVSGIVSNVKDSMIFNIGDTLTINAKLFESDGITQYKEAVFSYYIDGLAFTNNSVKFTKPVFMKDTLKQLVKKVNY